MTDEQERRLWDRYRADRGDGDRDALMALHLAWVRSVAAAFSRRLPRHVDREEIESDAVLGLMQVIAAFDPARGVRFRTFAAPRIRFAILDELRRRDWLGRPCRIRAVAREEAAASIRAVVGRAPSPAELARRMGQSVAAMAEDERRHRAGQPRSLSSASDRADRPCRRPTQLADPRAPDPATVVIGELIRRERMDRLLDGLGRRDRLIVVLRYVENLDMWEIGVATGYSESRISQILMGLLPILRDRLRMEEAS